MPDDPKKKGEPDRSLFDRSQEHEMRYMIDEIRKLRPDVPSEKIRRVINSAPSKLIKRDEFKKYILNNL